MHRWHINQLCKRSDARPHMTQLRTIQLVRQKEPTIDKTQHIYIYI